VKVIVYHRCGHGASGSAFGPGLVLWWAELAERWHFRFVGDELTARADLEVAIRDAADLEDPADLVRADQDRRGEAVG
jgi:hypothetical protein